MNLHRAQTATTKKLQKYSLKACAPRDLSDAELATCLEIVQDGGAAAISLKKLKNARILAVAHNAGAIVAVGSLKRYGPGRAAEISRRSGFGFPEETPELATLRSLRGTADNGFLTSLSAPCSKPCPARLQTINT
jgi:hypothetical protein